MKKNLLYRFWYFYNFRRPFFLKLTFSIQKFRYCIILFPFHRISDMFHPRNWTWSWLHEHCAARFGVKPQPRALVDLWGFDSRLLVPKTGASRIIFTNGLNDGWSVGGIKVIFCRKQAGPIPNNHYWIWVVLI